MPNTPSMTEIVMRRAINEKGEGRGGKTLMNPVNKRMAEAKVNKDGTIWVFKHKTNTQGIVVGNKASLLLRDTLI